MSSKKDTDTLFSKALTLMAEGQFEHALKKFEVAGVKGHGRAALMAGILSVSGFGSVSLEETDHAADALFWFRRAGELGEAEGQYKYAEMLSQGFGTEEDKGEAWKWASRAAVRHEHPKALYYMWRADTAFHDPMDFEQRSAILAVDFEQRSAMLAKAADQGHSGAQSVVGLHGRFNWEYTIDSAEQGDEHAAQILMSHWPDMWKELGRELGGKGPRLGFPKITFADVSAQEDLQRRVVYLSDYEPYRDGSNPRFNGASQRLLDLKRGDPDAIDYFAALLNRKMQEMATCVDGVDLHPSVLVTMPSHQADAPGEESPIDQVCTLVADSNEHMQDGRHCLYRTETVERQAGGKRRSLQSHYESLGLRDLGTLRSQVVILLDDVVTTGRSMRAAYYRLKQAKVREVICVALAGTVRS
jgi:TPR repeat protein